MTQGSCYKCGEKLQYESVVGRRDDCPKCGYSIHSCKNCQFYDQSSYNECREPSADVVKDKEASNFCDFYALGSPDATGESKDALVSAAEALFKKK